MTIAIVGLGLIGGSLAKDIRIHHLADSIIGVDKSEAHRTKALDIGLVDEIMPLTEAIAKSQLIILATPVDVMESILIQVLDSIHDKQIVMDVGSTKSNLIRAAQDHPMRNRYVATHPMAGTEYSGPEAAISNLFLDKCCVFCDTDQSDGDALRIVKKLYEDLGMRIVYHSGDDHDVHSAYVSHISHISSFALALTVLEKEKDENRIFELASGGFSSTVRLAKSSADTWIPIFEKNRDNVLDVLDEHINTISKFRTLLIKKDFNSFYQLIEQANKIEKILK